MRDRCGTCEHWECSLHVGHNLGYCEIKKGLKSRFSEACEYYTYTANNPPQVIYGFQYRAKREIEL